MTWQTLYNPFVIWLLRSPLHRLISGSTMLITVTGRKSGRRYTTPVNYVRDGNDLLVISQANRTWWKNLRGGAPVTVDVRGQRWVGTGRVAESPAAVADELRTLLPHAPALRRYLGVELDAAGQPTDPNALANAAHGRVVVRVGALQPTPA